MRPRNRTAPNPTVALDERWIPIPAKYYVPQVPQEYFNVIPKKPGWMRLPEAPQELQLMKAIPVLEKTAATAEPVAVAK